MEEIEIRDAIRRHVSTGEPPLGLTAQQMLHLGQHKQRWRIGLGVGSGGATVAVLVAGSLTFAPLAGTPSPELDRCSLPLARGWSAAPSGPPDYPMPTDPGAIPTITGWPQPTNYPTSSAEPTPPPSLDPDFGGPSVVPSPSESPTSTPVRTRSPEASALPTDEPGPSFRPTQTPIFPTDPPPTVPPTPERVLKAQCYLAEKLKQLAPEARFAPDAAEKPFQFYGGGEWFANGIIVRGNAASQLHIIIGGPSNFGPDQQLSGGWRRSTVNGLVVHTLRRGDGLLIVDVFFKDSTAHGFLTGTLISEEDLASLLASAELDIAG